MTTAPIWTNTRLAKLSVSQEAAKLKAQPGKNIALLGSSDLALTFIEQGLIDEYLLILNPVAIGTGQPLFKGPKERLGLKLEGTQTFGSGVVVLKYGAARKADHVARVRTSAGVQTLARRLSRSSTFSAP